MSVISFLFWCHCLAKNEQIYETLFVVPPPPWGDPLTLKRCSWGRFPIYMLELVSNLWTQMQCIQFALSCPQTDLTAAFIHHQIQIARRIEKGMSKWTFELRSITFSCAHFSLSFSSCGCHFSFLFSSSWLSIWIEKGLSVWRRICSPHFLCLSGLWLFSIGRSIIHPPFWRTCLEFRILLLYFSLLFWLFAIGPYIIHLKETQ